MPACHEMCMEASDMFDDQERFVFVPLTMVVLFDESDGVQMGAGVSDGPGEQKKPMHTPPNDPEPEEDEAATVTVFKAVAVPPPPEHDTT